MKRTRSVHPGSTQSADRPELLEEFPDDDTAPEDDRGDADDGSEDDGDEDNDDAPAKNEPLDAAELDSHNGADRGLSRELPALGDKDVPPWELAPTDEDDDDDAAVARELGLATTPASSPVAEGRHEPSTHVYRRTQSAVELHGTTHSSPRRSEFVGHRTHAVAT